MPLSWNEIRDRAVRFAREWEGESSEDAEAKTFWDGFFDVFGVTRRRLAQFEAPVQLVKNQGKTATGYVDLFWKGRLLVEHKSRGKSLDLAYAQAVDYFEGIAERDLPRYVLVSDFARFRLYDLETDERSDFALPELPKQIRLFGFIAGYEARPVRPQDPVNLRAAERMGRLHDRLKAAGYEGHDLEVLLVRLLFCLFADDTGIFQPPQAFREWIEGRTAVDGSDLGAKLTLLFQVLNTPEGKRQRTLDEQVAAFPYVNGRLFEERLGVPDFDAAMRTDLLDACALDWGLISPAVFGALFQSIMDPKARRNLGAHYTSEENILKLIGPLFLDDLEAELAAAKGNVNKLFELQKKLRRLAFLDPACGCGNFLVVAYRELRRIELEILRVVAKSKSKYLDILHAVQVNVDQFYGIEIEEFPAQIAQVALWLTDHQMNQRVSEEFGHYYARLPLTTSPTIVQGNALRLDWEGIVPKEQLSYILGNPPFGGKHYQSGNARLDQLAMTAEIKSGSDLDFVACWFIKASRIVEGSEIRVAFVATNSITQGEQVPLLWRYLLGVRGMHIQFAHRTFKWSNEGRSVAAVHCVIVGFGAENPGRKRLFDYDSPTSAPHELSVTNISPYLSEGPDVWVLKSQRPICEVPGMGCGSKPADGGHLILSDEERRDLLREAPWAKEWLRPFIGSDEYLNGGNRWCLWLVNVAPAELRRTPPVVGRVQRVRDFRLSSSAAPTRAAADRSSVFFFLNQPTAPYIAVPEVSSERRTYIPIGLLSEKLVSSNKIYIIASQSRLVFGVLQSSMHMAWARLIAGRLKSDFQYSATMVYNTFPWPESPTGRQQQTIEEAAQGVLDARVEFPKASLADLYDPLTMPAALLRAHQKLDKAVDAAYGIKTAKTDAERVAFLFALYQKYTSLFPAAAPARKRRMSERRV